MRVYNNRNDQTVYDLSLFLRRVVEVVHSSSDNSGCAEIRFFSGADKWSRASFGYVDKNGRRRLLVYSPPSPNHTATAVLDEVKEMLCDLREGLFFSVQENRIRISTSRRALA